MRANAAYAAPGNGWAVMTLAVWLVVWVGLLLFNAQILETRAFHDPDDELRLVQVRDLLAGQNWFDLTQHRVAAASGGVPMHWSRLVDAPIAALIALLTPFLSAPRAEFVALLAVPAMTFLAMLTLVGWMASRTLEPGGRLIALLALSFAAPAVTQVFPLRIDHHGWQIVAALAAVAALRVRDARRGGWLAGAALAVWMAISLEGLPLSACYIAILAGMTWWDGAMRVRLVATMQGLAAASLALFAATRGLADLAVHCDAIAPVHLVIFAWGALAIGLAATRFPQSRAALAIGLAAAAVGALGLIAAWAPRCASGSFDMLDPVVRGFWYDSVLEGKPLWQAEWPMLAQYLLPALVGLGASVSLTRRSRGDLRRWWLFYSLMLAAAVVLSLLVTRSAAFSGALAALPLGWRIAGWIGALRRPSNPLLRVAELTAMAALVFLVLFPAVAVAAAQTAWADKPQASAAGAPKLACNAALDGGAISALPAGDILAPLDFGPNVLLNTNKGVLATGHHRGAPAMRAVIDAFTGTPERARAIMAAHRLSYVMICPQVQEMDLYRQRAPHGFAAKLLEGKTPAWLRPVPLPEAAGLRMWALTAEAGVRPAGTSAPPR